MKRFIVRIVLFFALSLLLDCIVSRAGDYFQSHAVGGYTKMTNDLLMINQHDILVMGSSRAHHQYDTPYLTEALELDVYNAGYDGNGAILAAGILDMIFERYRPKLILYDVEPRFDINCFAGDNNNTRYIATLKPYYRNPSVASIIKDVSFEEWIKVHSGMMRYNTQIMQLIIDGVVDRASFPQGYDKAANGSMSEEPKRIHEEAIEDPLKIKYLTRIIELCKSNGVIIAMVASPKYGRESSSDLEIVKRICKDYSVPFIDYYSDPDIVHRLDLFKDEMHLNASGTEIYTRKIAFEIEKLLSEKNEL